jgi:hypothetical protein
MMLVEYPRIFIDFGTQKGSAWPEFEYENE